MVKLRVFIYDDNFLSDSEIDQAESIFRSSEPRWRYSPGTVKIDHENYPTIVSSSEFSDSAYFCLVPEKDTQDYYIAENIVKKFAEKNNIEYKEILRIMCNMTPIRTESFIARPHVDSPNPHYIFLYYVNDAYGDTVMFNERYTGQKVENVSILRSVKPKRGAAFLADGSHFHCSTIPNQGDIRKVINYNLSY